MPRLTRLFSGLGCWCFKCVWRYVRDVYVLQLGFLLLHVKRGFFRELCPVSYQSESSFNVALGLMYCYHEGVRVHHLSVLQILTMEQDNETKLDEGKWMNKRPRKQLNIR